MAANPVQFTPAEPHATPVAPTRVAPFVLEARAATMALLAGVALLVAGWLLVLGTSRVTGHDNMFGLVGLFDVNAESNLPTWYSSVLLLVGGLLAAAVARLERALRSRWWRHWAVLGVGFVAMSAVEATLIRESIGHALGRFVDIFPYPVFNWVLPFVPLAVLIGLWFVRFLIALPRADAARFVVAGAVYLGGAVGMELAGAAWLVGRPVEAGEALTFHAILLCEEVMEMIGAVLFIRAVLLYAARAHGGLCVATGNMSHPAGPRRGR